MTSNNPSFGYDTPLTELNLAQDLFILTAVGRNPRTPVGILSILAQHWEGQDGVAGNPRTPAGILTVLSGSGHHTDVIRSVRSARAPAQRGRAAPRRQSKSRSAP